jgi:uncharacterized protein (DUF1778 family)
VAVIGTARLCISPCEQGVSKSDLARSAPAKSKPFTAGRRNVTASREEALQPTQKKTDRSPFQFVWIITVQLLQFLGTGGLAMAKQDRIDFRIDESVKAQFSMAAEAYGMNLSSFMIAAAQEQVIRARRRLDTLKLSDRDRDAFLHALDQSARPVPAALVEAKKRQGKRITSG